METQNTSTTLRGNGSAEDTAVAQTASVSGSAERPRVISDPNDVATVVLMQIDAVNDRKNDLTIAVKGLTDLAKQLMRSYSDLTATVRAQQTRIRELEEKLAKAGA